MRRSRRLLALVALAGAFTLVACGPPQGKPAPGPGVLAVGDSVMLGGADALRAAIPGIEIDAVMSRQFRELPGIIAARAQAGTLPGTIVIHLGTNGSLSGSDCDAMVAASGNRRVIIVNLTVPRPWEGPNNVALHDCAVRDNTALVDWHAMSAGRSDLLEADGFHLKPAGAQKYASAIAAAR